MTIHIHWTEPLREIVRRPDGEARYCFICRQRRAFDYVVEAPVAMSYYGPTPSIRCATCGTVDGDLFPGHEREWSDV